MNDEYLEQLQLILLQAAQAANISTTEALAELVRAFLLSGEVHGIEFVKQLDKSLLKK